MPLFWPPAAIGARAAVTAPHGEGMLARLRASSAAHFVRQALQASPCTCIVLPFNDGCLQAFSVHGECFL